MLGCIPDGIMIVPVNKQSCTRNLWMNNADPILCGSKKRSPYALLATILLDCHGCEQNYIRFGVLTAQRCFQDAMLDRHLQHPQQFLNQGKGFMLQAMQILADPV